MNAQHDGKGLNPGRIVAAGAVLLTALLIAGCKAQDETKGESGLGGALSPRTGINVVVVSFDALRADHLGFYGYSRPVSPIMDEFARGAVIFDDAWAASSSTPSSFASVFTGRLAPEVFRGWKLIRTPTLAEHFAAAGYATAFVTSNVQLVATRGFDQGFEHYELVTSGVEGADEGSLSLDLEVLARARERLRMTRKPFFLWIHFLSPHAPYEYREASSHLYDGNYSGPFATTSGHTFEAATQADLDRLVDLYDGEVLFADQVFGEVLQELVAQRLEDNTLVVLTADHGEEFMDHGGLQHQGVHQEVLRVPLVIRHPDWRGSGKRSSVPVSHLDLPPTLSAAADLRLFESGSGASLLGPLDAERHRIGVAMTDATEHYVAGVSGSEKIIVACREKTVSLFDLASDPEEAEDLGNERNRKLRSMVADLKAAFGGDPCDIIAQASGGSLPTSALTEEQVRQLRALGYLGGGEGREASASPTQGRIWAVPNPILDCPGLGVGETTVHWEVLSASDTIEIRLLPGNQLFAAGGRVGTQQSGPWVRDGMGFAAVEQPSGTVLAVTKVALTLDGCP